MEAELAGITGPCPSCGQPMTAPGTRKEPRPAPQPPVQSKPPLETKPVVQENPFLDPSRPVQPKPVAESKPAAEIKPAVIYDMGGKLSGESSVVSQSKVTDGPFVEVKEIVGGYMIVEAESMEKAIEVIQESPGVGSPESTVEIREIEGVEFFILGVGVISLALLVKGIEFLGGLLDSLGDFLLDTSLQINLGLVLLKHC